MGVKSWVIFLVFGATLFGHAWAAKAERKSSSSIPRSMVAFGDPIAGKEKADSERCQECHGVDGNGAGHANGPEGKFAKLAGQHPQYILKQLQDFRSGLRKHDQMAIMARSVTDEDVRDIAAYFSGLPFMKGEPGPTSAAIERLFHEGDPQRGVVACASCHGPGGRGPTATPLTPILRGQEWRYIEKQLLDWRSGFRKNSADGVMSSTLKPLTDSEIKELADYLASE